MLPGAWKNLGPARRSLAVFYLRLLFFKHILQGAPGPVRLAILHSLATLFALFLLPPPPQTPPIAIPIVWGASWGIAITIYGFTSLLKFL